MKRHTFFTLMLVAVLCFAMLFCGCESKDNSGTSDPTASQDTASEQTAPSQQTEPSEPGQSEPSDPVQTEPTGSQQTEPSIPEATTPESPEQILIDAFNKTFAQNNNSMLEDMTCSKITIDFQDTLNNVLYLDAEELRIVDELLLRLDSEEYQFNIFADEGGLAVSAPAILGDAAYGVVFSTLAEDLPNSVIWDLVGISYEDFLEQSGLNDLNAFDLIGISGAVMDAKADLDAALENVTDCVEVSTSEGTVNINGQDIKATIITYSMTDDDLIEIANILIDWAEVAYADILNELKDSFAGTETGEMLEEMDIPFTDLRFEIEEIFSDTDMKMDLCFNISDETDCLLSMNYDAVISYAGSDEAYIGEQITIFSDLIWGENPSDYLSFEFGITLPDGESAGIQGEYSHTDSETASQYAMTIKVLENGEEVERLFFNLDYNKSGTDYQLTIGTSEEELKVVGKYSQTDNSLVFGIDEITVDEEPVAVDLTVTVEGIDSTEIPNTPDYKNILTMTEDEIVDLIEIIQNNLQ